jgi:RNA polymerase sigma-70 factor (ECF subfamily)
MPGEIDDAALVEAAQQGDRAALDQLLRRHYDRIHAVCRRIAGGTRDADDATQEALIKIARGLPRFDGNSAFGTWAYRIATNAALDELRKRRRRPLLAVADPDDEWPRETTDPTAARRIDAVADRLAIDEAMAELSDEFRVAVTLRDVIDLDYAEIASVLDVPVGTVKSRIARGRAMLAKRLRLEDLPPIPDDGNNETDSLRPNEPT